MLRFYVLKVKIPATVTDRKSHQYDSQTKYFKIYRRPYRQEQLVVKSTIGHHKHELSDALMCFMTLYPVSQVPLNKWNY